MPRIGTLAGALCTPALDVDAGVDADHVAGRRDVDVTVR